MKILIVGFAKIKYMPYLNLYLENLNRRDNEIHLVYWNRDEKAEDLSSVEELKLHEFKCYQEDEVPKKSKLKSFFKFKKYVNSVLKENFDFIIVLQTVTAVLLSDVLLSKRFKDKYIYDYRDCTYENIMPYKLLVQKLVNNSKFTFVSSRGFKKYLPDSNKIKYVHNVLTSDLVRAESEHLPEESSEKIRIGFWGFLREEKINLEIIKRISKDQRFELHYYGREQKTVYNLKDYVLGNQIKNVFFHGEYNPEEKYEFLKNTDIIHNIYEEDKMLSAMSNKYYDAIIFQMPQICMVGSYMGALAESHQTGCQTNPYRQNFTEEIYGYFTKMNFEEFEQSCHKEKENILLENKELKEIIKNIL